jgi:hypothetical protein
MTIQFHCPNCNALIAFDNKHIGKRARCLTCGQVFIIPSRENEIPQKIEPKIEKGQVLPGFYRAVFIDSWKIFINSNNATALVFVAAAVCFKFFTGHTDYSFDVGDRRFQAPIGQIVTIAAWGALLWYYMEIIYSTAFDTEDLPEVYVGGFFGFLWNIVKSICTFFIALVIVLLPCVIALVISNKIGVEWLVLSHVLAIAGLFAFPMAILILSVGRDITMLFRPDYIVWPVVRAFGPYLVTVAFFLLACQLQLWLEVRGYGRLLGSGKTVIGLHLLANLGVQVIAIIAMRSIGLFHRHYSPHFPW